MKANRQKDVTGTGTRRIINSAIFDGTLRKAIGKIASVTGEAEKGQRVLKPN